MNTPPLRVVRPRQPEPGTGFWTPSAWFLAQVNHALCGLFLFAFLQAGVSVWVPVVGIMAWATVKEFILDLTVLEHDSFWGSMQDFLAYAGGVWTCWLATKFFATGAIFFGAGLLFLTLADIARQHMPQRDDLT